MRTRMPWMLTLTLLAACGAPDDTGDPRVQQLRDGELPADNLIIYDRGRRKTVGMQVLGASGSFELAGPTVVYVFRTFNPGDAEQMRRDGISAEENSAFLLPSGAAPTLEALQQMRLIGPVDPAMTDEQLAREFRLGEAAGTATPSPPVRPDSAPRPAPSPAPQSDPPPVTEIPLQAATEKLDEPQAKAPRRGAAEDARIAKLGGRLNEALAMLAGEMRDGVDSQTTRQEIKDIQLELQGLLAAQDSNAAGQATDRAAVVQSQSIENFRQPATATCASYNALEQSAAETAAVNAALTAYAKGFAGALLDYQACGAASFDESGYLDHLAEFCRAQPEKTVRDSVVHYVCSDGS